MKKNRLLIAIVVFFLLAVGIGLNLCNGTKVSEAQVSQKANYEFVSNIQQTNQDLIRLKENFLLENTPITPGISDAEAFHIACNNRPDYASQASNICVEYYNVTDYGGTGLSDIAKQKNPSLNAGIKESPCYIVSFEGISRYPHGPKGMTLPMLHEYNVFIDAMSGEVLFGFVYR